MATIGYILFIAAYCSTLCLQTNAQTSSFTNGCPNLCTCQYIQSNSQNILLITCTGPQLNYNFVLPDQSTVPALATITALVIRNSYLAQFPSNLCTYGATLLFLDLSTNQLSQNITTSTVNCLTKLQYLNVSSNSIAGVSSDSFDSLTNLFTLDLSYNKLTYLPPALFYMKLNTLTTLKLQHNQLTELDIWFVFLKSIVYLDMSSNLIAKFTNTIGFSTASSPYEQIMNAEIVDFRYNKFTKFDDTVLALYSVCNINAFAYFLRLLQKIRLDTNPFDCSCSSYNLLGFYQTYISSTQYLQLISNNIFMSNCATPALYAAQSVFTFMNVNNCPSSLYFNGTCPVATRYILSRLNFIDTDMIIKYSRLCLY